MEELMASQAAVRSVLGYLFARFDERFGGAQTLLILDESWLFLDDTMLAARIRQWLKTLRKRNVSVIRSAEHSSEIQSLMRLSYDVFTLIDKTHNDKRTELIY